MFNPSTLRRRIYLVRHAEVAYFDECGKPLNPRDVSLTDNGRSQAQTLASALADVPFDLAICSGLPRTEQTAQRLLGARDLELRSDPRLQEIRAGRLRDIPARLRETTIAYAYDGAELLGARFIGGETWESFRERVLQTFNELIANPAWKNLLIVAHDAANRVVLSHILGSGLAGLRAIEQDPACLNIIETDRAEPAARPPFIRTINLTAYDLIRADQQMTVMEKVFKSYAPGDNA